MNRKLWLAILLGVVVVVILLVVVFLGQWSTTSIGP